jgi:hypothetical protein
MVWAVDACGNVITNYTGTVHLSSDDGVLGLPMEYTFTPEDAGCHKFSIAFQKPGIHQLWAVDTMTGSLMGKLDGILVLP